MAAVPVSAFYTGGGIRHFARFSFCKDFATIDEAVRRLEAWSARGGRGS